jgi:hypothetical protein
VFLRRLFARVEQSDRDSATETERNGKTRGLIGKQYKETREQEMNQTGKKKTKTKMKSRIKMK